MLGKGFFVLAVAHLVSFLLENYRLLVTNSFEVLGDKMKALAIKLSAIV